MVFLALLLWFSLYKFRFCDGMTKWVDSSFKTKCLTQKDPLLKCENWPCRESAEPSPDIRQQPAQTGWHLHCEQCCFPGAKEAQEPFHIHLRSQNIWARSCITTSTQEVNNGSTFVNLKKKINKYENTLLYRKQIKQFRLFVKGGRRYYLCPSSAIRVTRRETRV